MHSKNFEVRDYPRVCVLARNRHVAGMEVRRYRIAGVLFAALISAATFHAHSASDSFTTNLFSANASVITNINTNTVRASFPPPRELDNQHKLRPGDKLSFRVAEDGEEAKSLPVTDSGEIELPLGLGRFTASGKTCRSLAQEIKVTLEKDYYKRATVQLAIDTYNSVLGKVYVSGVVAKQGPVNIPVDAPLKLSQAILLAGTTQWSQLKTVKVVRSIGKETQTMIVDVDAILNKGHPEKDIVLAPDDLVIVGERGVLVGGG
jgi:polysaccharide export outer membrane protein